MTVPRFKTIYLHIGLEKTGTTSIQGFLDKNRAALEPKGICFPRSIGPQNQKHLAAYALELESRDSATRMRGPNLDADALSSYRRDIEDKFRKDVSSTNSETLLISSEDLSRLFKAEEIERVLSFLRPYGDNIKVIVFLRRQDLLATSRYYSLVLGGRYKADVFPKASDPVPAYYDYNTILSRWIEKIGAQNVLAYRFPEVPRLTGFNSVSAFCDVLGLEVADFEPVEDMNISLDAVNQLILQNFNMLHSRSEHSARQREALIAELSRFRDKKCRYISSARQAEGFYERLRPGNRMLFDALGLPSDFFSDDFSMYPRKNMRSPYMNMASRRLLTISGFGS